MKTAIGNSFSRWFAFGTLIGTIPLVGWASLPWLWSASGTLRTFAIIAFVATASAVIVPRLYYLIYLPLTVILLLFAALARGFELDPLWGPMNSDTTPIVGWMYALPLTLLGVAAVLAAVRSAKPSSSNAANKRDYPT